MLNKLRTAINKATRAIRVKIWFASALIRRAKRELWNRSNWFLRAGSFLACVAIAYVLPKAISPTASGTTWMTALLAAAAMAGGIIAIVFSLSTFSLQNAADLFSSEFFERYAYGWKDKVTYWSIVGTVLLLFVGATTIDGPIALSRQQSQLVLVALLLGVVLIFILVDWQYESVRKRVNPLYALRFLESEANQFLKSMHSAAIDASRLVKLEQDEISDEVALARVYNIGLKAALGAFDRRLEVLSEVAIRLASKEDSFSAKRAFDIIARLIAEYLEVRKGSSLMQATEIPLAFESDSSNLLRRAFERINAAGESFMSKGQSDIAAHLVGVYDVLAEKARSIVFLGAPENENPIFADIQGYHRQYIDCAVRRKDLEVVFQGSRALQKMALWAVERNLNHVLSGIQRDLLYVSQVGILNKATFITQNCFDAWLNIILQAFQVDYEPLQHEVGEALRNIATTVTLYQQGIRAGLLASDFSDHLALARPYDGLPGIILQAVRRYDTIQDARQKESCRRRLIGLFEEINRSLRTLSEQLRTCDSPVIPSIGRLLFATNQILIRLIARDEFADVREDLRKRLQWNVHLPEWFFHHAEVIQGGVLHTEISDSVVRTGILLASNGGDSETIKACIDAIASIAQSCLKKMASGYGFDEPRLMLGVCYLGILGLKRGVEPVWIHAGLKIYEFEEAYAKKYVKDVKLPAGVSRESVTGLPREDQLFVEFFRWASDFNHRRLNDMRLGTSADELMFDRVDQSDIDRFMYEVWGTVPSDSPILEEVRDTLQMGVLRQRLVALLRLLIEQKKGGQ